MFNRYDLIAEELERRGETALAVEVDKFASAIYASDPADRAAYQLALDLHTRITRLMNQLQQYAISTTDPATTQTLGQVISKGHAALKGMNCVDSVPLDIDQQGAANLKKIWTFLQKEQQKYESKLDKERQEIMQVQSKHDLAIAAAGALAVIMASTALFYVFIKVLGRYAPKLVKWLEKEIEALKKAGYKVGDKLPGRIRGLLIKALEKLSEKLLHLIIKAAGESKTRTANADDAQINKLIAHTGDSRKRLASAVVKLEDAL